MARTIYRTGGGHGFLAGDFQRGRWGDGLGSVRQIVHDGDTVNVSSAANFPIRFLGIDTPESSYPPPGSRSFAATDAPEFAALLADPLSAAQGAFLGLTERLAAHLAARAHPQAAADHHHYAKAAEDALEALIEADFAALGTEAFFLAFAYDVLDGYGRLLAYVLPAQPDAAPEDRRDSYNLRMLGTGLAEPYFIFPNVDPFRARGSPLEAAMLAADPPTILAAAPSLRRARALVAEARAAGRGVFDPGRPNAFAAFELRFIARRRAPDRWVIDLAGTEAVLHQPADYVKIPHAEDRLWVPEEFVPLFRQAGWRIDGPLWMNR